MNSDLKKNLIIANGFFLLLIAFYILLRMGPLSWIIFLVGWVLLNLTIIFK